MHVSLFIYKLHAADGVATADADPLGVDMNVTFENVGGLDNRKLTVSRSPDAS